MSDALNSQASVASPSTSVRYHSLDALRSYAMLMGILLHMAIYFMPYYFTGRIFEWSCSDGFTYVIYFTHMFRMQLFFLLAGFFARLLFLRIGYLGFAWHRFSRIVVPFIVGWLIMYPLCTLYHVWAGVAMEDILTDQPFWQFLVSRIIGDELGGFSLIHLWFLNTLLQIYVIVIASEWVLAFLLDRRGHVRHAVDGLFGWLMKSRFNVIWLALLLWPIHYWIGDWFGITTPSDSLWPDSPTLTVYTLFFVVGWLLHGQTHLLKQFEKRWAFNLLLGTAISIPLFLFFNHSYLNGTITFAYPLLSENEMRDYSAIRSAVRQDGNSDEVAGTAIFRSALPPLYLELVERTPAPTVAQMTGWMTQINKNVILDPKAFQPGTDEERRVLAELKAEASRRGHGSIAVDATTAGTPLENRWLLDAAFPPNTFAENIKNQPHYRAILAAFLAAYAVGSWLLIFGSTGLFMRYFSNPSPLVRYMADSSYWLYLIHFPVLWQINILVGKYQWHWLPKSLLYTAIAFAIMMPSYHYLVRSTWIGKFLNGRTYPFRPWFRRPESDSDNKHEQQPRTTRTNIMAVKEFEQS